MIAYVIRRLLYAIPILVGVNVITFTLFFVVNSPDDMARVHLGVKRVTPEAVQIGIYDGQTQEFATLMPAVDATPRDDILLRTYLGTNGLGLSGADEDKAAPVGVLAFRVARPLWWTISTPGK